MRKCPNDDGLSENGVILPCRRSLIEHDNKPIALGTIMHYVQTNPNSDTLPAKMGAPNETARGFINPGVT